MCPKQRPLDDEIINLSMTELLMLLAFLFLIVIAVFTTRISRAEQVRSDSLLISRLIQEIAEDTDLVDKLYFQDNSRPKNTENLVDELNRMQEMLKRFKESAATDSGRQILKKYPLPKVWNRLVLAEQEAAQLDGILADMLRGLPEGTNLREEFDQTMGRLAAMRQELKTAEEHLRDARNELAKTQTTNSLKPVMTALGVTSAEDIWPKVQALLTKNDALTTELQEKRYGVPLCWTQETDQLQYIYTVKIRETPAESEGGGISQAMFEIDRVWDESLRERMIRLGAPLAEETLVMSASEFAEIMQVFWNYGECHDHCRFYVNVLDRTVTKDVWKSGLALVERYFYKRTL